MSARSRNIDAGNRDAYLASTKPPGPLEGLQPGDEVAYTAYWLASVGLGPTDAAAGRRGRVSAEPTDLGADFVKVQWNDVDEPTVVNTRNLARPGPNLRYCRG